MNTTRENVLLIALFFIAMTQITVFVIFLVKVYYKEIVSKLSKEQKETPTINQYYSFILRRIKTLDNFIKISYYFRAFQILFISLLINTFWIIIYGAIVVGFIIGVENTIKQQTKI